MIPHEIRTQSTVNADRWRLKSRRHGKFRKFNMKYTCGNVVLAKFLLIGSSALVLYMPLCPARSPRESEFIHYCSTPWLDFPLCFQYILGTFLPVWVRLTCIGWHQPLPNLKHWLQQKPDRPMTLDGIIYGYLMSPSPGHACGAKIILSDVVARYALTRKQQHRRATRAKAKLRHKCAARMTECISIASITAMTGNPQYACVRFLNTDSTHFRHGTEIWVRW